jgi:hypothetical protein
MIVRIDYATGRTDPQDNITNLGRNEQGDLVVTYGDGSQATYVDGTVVDAWESVYQHETYGHEVESEIDVETAIGYEEGDLVVDENPPPWAEKKDERGLEVIRITDTPAHEYEIDTTSFGTNTVADANPSYRSDEIVVEAAYVDGGGTYAYPATRLSAKDNE